MEKTCEYCRFWDKKNMSWGSSGKCRRFPPKPFVIFLFLNVEQCPTTQDCDWCGEWKPLE